MVWFNSIISEQTGTGPNHQFSMYNRKCVLFILIKLYRQKVLQNAVQIVQDCPTLIISTRNANNALENKMILQLA